MPACLECALLLEMKLKGGFFGGSVLAFFDFDGIHFLGQCVFWITNISGGEGVGRYSSRENRFIARVNICSNPDPGSGLLLAKL